MPGLQAPLKPPPLLPPLLLLTPLLLGMRPWQRARASRT